ncbi:MAG: glycoside hydrolase family 9 protein [Thiohalocapsa sp.]|nr:glycoside hydrolase family 9 protein [Thiohalocapsa sp.]
MPESPPLRPFATTLLAVLAASIAVVPDARGGDLLLYDESADMQFTQLDRIYEEATAAHAGLAGLRVMPTQHHRPLMRLASGRTDFRPFSSLDFYIRAAGESADPTIFLLDALDGTHRRIAEYVDGGVIDAQWRRVQIPIGDLASDDFALDSVFLIGFAPEIDPRDFFIDDIVLRDRRRPTLGDWSMPSSRTLSIAVDLLDPASAADASRVTLLSASDPDFQAPLGAEAIGLERAAVGVTPAGLKAETRWRVHLQLPVPLKPGHAYQVDLSALRSPADMPLAEPMLTVMPTADAISSSIKVNQVGYLPTATKIAFVGNWLGDYGPMPVEETLFRVVRAGTDTVVLSGQLELRIADDVRSGEDVHTADFSALAAPGSYQVEVPCIGRSHPFDIAADVYDDVYRTTMRLFYHKRNTALTAPYADPGYERAGIDPLLDAVFHPVLETYPLSRGETAFDYKPTRMGWYDAGDYGQYVHNAAPVWPALALALDLAADGHFADGELGIPESGNGIPDILDELRWGMQWALSMQDDDGGVYWRVASGHFDMGMPADVAEPRFIYEKTTRATAQFAAMGAIYSRLMQRYRPAEADAVLDAALRAWAFVANNAIWPPEGTHYTNPPQYPGGGTYAVGSSIPDMMWAAAELYRSTGDTVFQAHYRSLLGRVSMDLSAAPNTTWGYWAMANAPHANRDILLVENARRSIMVAADMKLNRSASAPYRSAKHPYIPYTGWYNFSVSPIDALALLQAHHLGGEPVYLDVATQLLDIILGANPQSKVYLTGIGDDPVRDPMDRISLNDANPEPVRGMSVAGPTWHLPGFREPYISVNAAYWPPNNPVTENDFGTAYPVLRRWIDNHQLIPMNESTVREWAPVAAAFGLLRFAASPPLIAARPYTWSPQASTQTVIYRLGDVPVADVPLLTPAHIAALGSEAVNGSSAHLAALTGEQVAAIDAPSLAYWVAKLSVEQRLALTADQIAAFTHSSLFVPLPPQLVAFIPPASMPLIGSRLAETSAAWKAAVTAEQFAAMTPEQQAVMLQAGYTPPEPQDGSSDSDGDTDAGSDPDSGTPSDDDAGTDSGTDPNDGIDTDDGEGDHAADDSEAGVDDDRGENDSRKRPPGCDRRSGRADEAPGANPCEDAPGSRGKGKEADDDRRGNAPESAREDDRKR